MTTIAVLDSSPDVVSSLSQRLAGSFEVLGSTDELHVLDDIESGRAGILVTDILGAGIDGLTLVAKARRRLPHLPIVVVSTFADPDRPGVRRVALRYVVPGSRFASAEERHRLIAALTAESGSSSVRQHSNESGRRAA